jgi:hypothetical protein
MCAASTARAQPQPAIFVRAPVTDSATLAGPTIRVSGVLADNEVRELLHSGFPARLHYRTELWQARRGFDRLLRSVEWDVVVRFDALNTNYEIVRVVRDSVILRGSDTGGRFRTINDVVAQVEQPYRPAIVARSGLRQYYHVVLELEMLSVSDLDEVRRWVSGDLTPAVRGERNPGTALSRGARTLLTRLLGGERRTLEGSSAIFNAR